MKQKLTILFLSIFCIFLLTACGCEHAWAEADCVTSKTCTKCNATEGDSLGHNWQEATCDAPKTCSICNTTEGDALGHVPGAWSEAEPDYVAAVIRETCVCDRCGEAADTRETPLTTLASEDGTKFLCSANEFKQRIENAYAQINEVNDSHYRVEQTTANEEYYALTVYNGDSESASALYLFTTDGPSVVTLADADSRNVITMRMQVMDQTARDGMTHFIAGALACDPARDFGQATGDAYDIYMCAYDSTYHEQNGLRYAANFSTFAVTPISETK